MNPLALFFFLICAVALLTVPRKWAPAALLAGSIYMTLGQGIEIASINLPVYRMMLFVGVVRSVIKSEMPSGGLNTIDKLVIAWSFWMIVAGFFHDPERAGVIYHLGSVYNLSVVYFLMRAWCSNLEEVGDVVIIIALLLVPLAIEMLMEKASGKNLFSVFGGVSEYVQIREGKLRAQGPFLHPILAGTVGATCIPLFVGIYSKSRSVGILGITAGLVMVFASASSGPVMSLIFGVGSLLLWSKRQYLKNLRITALVTYLILMVTMTRPPYYLISRIDISGGSTGWHRCFLIEQTFKYLSEWWLFGTDETKHWMPMQGTAMDPHHTDVTNYYIGFGILGGLPAMLAVIAIVLIAFNWVGKIMNSIGEGSPNQEFMIYCFGASLFAHATTSISVAYFDQSMLFFWLTVAVISSTYANSLSSSEEEAQLQLDEATHFSNNIENELIPDIEWRRKMFSLNRTE